MVAPAVLGYIGDAKPRPAGAVIRSTGLGVTGPGMAASLGLDVSSPDHLSQFFGHARVEVYNSSAVDIAMSG
jgi:hypothetical protein